MFGSSEATSGDVSGCRHIRRFDQIALPDELQVRNGFDLKIKLDLHA